MIGTEDVLQTWQFIPEYAHNGGPYRSSETKLPSTSMIRDTDPFGFDHVKEHTLPSGGVVVDLCMLVLQFGNGLHVHIHCGDTSLLPTTACISTLPLQASCFDSVGYSPPDDKSPVSDLWLPLLTWNPGTGSRKAPMKEEGGKPPSNPVPLRGSSVGDYSMIGPAVQPLPFEQSRKRL